MAMRLDQIVPWGRSLREYELMFELMPGDRDGVVLDCGGGPSSFTAEWNQAGGRAVSVDPIYCFTGAEIQARYADTEQTVLDQVKKSPADWTWGYHRDLEDLRANRRAALARFLEDYDRGQREQRYIAGELPSLPMADQSVSLAVCSHLLFLYSQLLSEEFHRAAFQELCRVASEIRVFPLLGLDRRPSPYVGPVRQALAAEGWATEIRVTRYELQRGGNQMLRVYRAQT